MSYEKFTNEHVYECTLGQKNVLCPMGCDHFVDKATRETHLEVCDQKIVDCKNGCGQKVKRNGLEIHYSVCPRQSIQCEFC